MKIKAFYATPLHGGKKISCLHHFSPSSPQVQNLGQVALGDTENQLKLGPEEGGCHASPSELRNHETASPTYISHALHPGNKLLISVFGFTEGRRKIPTKSPAQLKTKKKCWIHDFFMSYNQPLHIYNPPVYLPSKHHWNLPISWALNPHSWRFPILGSLQLFRIAT